MAKKNKALAHQREAAKRANIIPKAVSAEDLKHKISMQRPDFDKFASDEDIQKRVVNLMYSISEYEGHINNEAQENWFVLKKLKPITTEKEFINALSVFDGTPTFESEHGYASVYFDDKSKVRWVFVIIESKFMKIERELRKNGALLKFPQG